MIYIASNHIGTEYALDHPRFCFQKWAGTYAASNTAAGADVDWLGNGNSWTQWRAANGEVTVTQTFATARTVSYVGIAVHDLDLAGAKVTLRIDTGSGFEIVPGLQGIQPTDDSAILFLIGPVDVVGVRLVIFEGTAPSIGIFQSGLAMELPRRSTYTALPISESEQTTYRHTQSIKGNVLDTTIEAAELRFGVSVSNLSEEWRETSGVNSWKAFTDHVRNAGSMFVATRPIGYADDVAFGVATERPRFNRAIPNRNISGEIELNFLGYKRP